MGAWFTPPHYSNTWATQLARASMFARAADPRGQRFAAQTERAGPSAIKSIGDKACPKCAIHGGTDNKRVRLKTLYPYTPTAEAQVNEYMLSYR